MTLLLRWVSSLRRVAGSMLVVVLVASMAVGALLAYQAIRAARERRAVSEGMLRQYAQLALGEFSRLARRDIENAVMASLTRYAHGNARERHSQAGCDCSSLETIEQWFEVRPRSEIQSPSGIVDARLREAIGKVVAAETDEGSENSLRIAALEHDHSRFIATKREPHLSSGAGRVGLVTTTSALAPVLAHSYRRGNLLPAALVGNRDARSFVDIRLIDANGAAVFASEHTHPGPYVVDAAFLPDLPLALAAHVSMTPEFISTLGPGHGAGPSISLVIALVLFNALLIGVGLWQLSRERELARLRTNFVAGVSHELRTPLAQIRMFSETLLLDRVRNSSEKRRALEIIGQESQRLSQLVDNVLHFHRQQSPFSLDVSRPIDFDEFVRDVVESFQPLASSRRVRIVVSSDVEDLFVRGDTGLLRQVLLNLLDNAVKFAPTDRTITLGLFAANGDALLTVDDQGPGVPVGERERIFNPFERGRETNGTGGAGIGLAVVRQIVAVHGGTVRVDDAPGGGARFTVSLPAVNETKRPQSAVRIAG